LDNDTVIIPAQAMGGENKNKYIIGPFTNEIMDTVIIYSNKGNSFWFIVNDFNRKKMQRVSCPAGKINSYNMVDVK
jgi:hypothetical protein